MKDIIFSFISVFLPAFIPLITFCLLRKFITFFIFSSLEDNRALEENNKINTTLYSSGKTYYNDYNQDVQESYKDINDNPIQDCQDFNLFKNFFLNINNIKK